LFVAEDEDLGVAEFVLLERPLELQGGLVEPLAVIAVHDPNQSYIIIDDQIHSGVKKE